MPPDQPRRTFRAAQAPDMAAFCDAAARSSEAQTFEEIHDYYRLLADAARTGPLQQVGIPREVYDTFCYLIGAAAMRNQGVHLGVAQASFDARVDEAAQVLRDYVRAECGFDLGVVPML